MLRLVGVFLVGATALASAAPRGRVVRVERPRGPVLPRLCDVQPAAGTGLCVGTPAIGERIALVDHARGVAVGEFRIEAVAAAAEPWLCPGRPATLFKVTGEVTDGTRDAVANAARIIGLRNLQLDRGKAAVIKDPTMPRPGERPELALDYTGDGDVDFLLARYGCDEHGNPAPGAEHRVCFDSYLARGGRLTRVHQDILELCF